MDDKGRAGGYRRNHPRFGKENNVESFEKEAAVNGCRSPISFPCRVALPEEHPVCLQKLLFFDEYQHFGIYNLQNAKNNDIWLFLAVITYKMLA
jgi:hypothetical protein